MERWKIKVFLKRFCFWTIFSYIFLFLFLVFISKLNVKDVIEVLSVLLLIAVVPAVIFIIEYLIMEWINKKKNYEGSYYKDVENLCPPAMLSLLLDDTVEGKKDLLATILNLSIKNILEIKKNKNKLIVNVIAEDYEIEKLYNHEKYIVNRLKNGRQINLEKFYENVVDDCIIDKLIIFSKHSLQDFLNNEVMKIIVILLALGTFLTILFQKSRLMFVLGSIIIIIFFLQFFKKKYKKTGKGIEFSAKAKMLKNYIREYTLLNEKDFNYIQLVDKYIPYALALGEASKIEDLYFIEENEFFKRFIVQMK